jgi:hypothetical protein
VRFGLVVEAGDPCAELAPLLQSASKAAIPAMVKMIPSWDFISQPAFRGRDLGFSFWIRIRRKSRVEKLTALIATALSWSGLMIWTLSWFVFMPLLVFLLGKSTMPPAHGI